MPIKLIVGLGNPGPEYEKTRHNAGAWFLETLAQQENVTLRKAPKFKGMMGVWQSADSEYRLFFPTTFMNCCGGAIKTLAHFYDVHPEEILIAHDELDLPVGIARFKKDGGHGGHNGLRDTITHLSSRDFYRLRLGIGHPGNKEDVADYVLKKPSKVEKQEIEFAIEKAIATLPLLLAGDMQKAMNELHTSI